MIKETLKKLTEALDTIADMEFEELKAEVAEDTDANCHTEAVLAIANHYGLKEFIDKFQKIKNYQDSPDYMGLTMEQAHERLDMTHKMFDELEKIIGIDKARELYSCL